MTDKIVPAALRLWLVFLLALFLVGYSVPTSILYGAIGGFAGGLVSAWWQTKGGVPQAPPIKERVSQMRERIQKTRDRLPVQRLFPWRNRNAPRGR